jgi:hypothetical protein
MEFDADSKDVTGLDIIESKNGLRQKKLLEKNYKSLKFNVFVVTCSRSMLQR